MTAKYSVPCIVAVSEAILCYTKSMKRWLFGGMAAVVLACGGSLPAHAAKNNFVITDYKVNMQLGRDKERRSTLTTTETITANFPPNQNHGLVRTFVEEYDGHHTNFTLRSVKDEHGNNLEYAWKEGELRIGNKNTYVEGQKTYVITYTQRDVTKEYADTGKTEFYWDAIGVDWRVPIQQAMVSLSVSDEIRPLLQTNLQCYKGLHGSNVPCDTIDTTTLTATATQLRARNGVTIAIGFSPGTFMPYQKSPAELFGEYWFMAQIPLSILAMVLIGVFSYMKWYMTGRKSEIKPIAPEYIPPKDASVLVSAEVLRQYDSLRGSAMVAQLLDLAVRHYIKLYEVSPATFFKSAQYEIEVVKDMQTLKAEEREVLSDMFDGSLPGKGQRLNLKKLQYNSSYAKRTLDNDKKLEELLRGEYDIQMQSAQFAKRFRHHAIATGLLALVGLSPAVAVAAIVAYVQSHGWSLTDKGLALRRYLAGLKMYIGVAEEERLKMLQSPEGAEKVAAAGFDTKSGTAQQVKLYERVLPYAVLFGQEKQWVKQLGEYYEQLGKNPDWYSGDGVFSAAVFASSMSNLSSAAASVSDYSSSSGGSSGSGFAGGGGGGGGGGGW